jgi:tRNA(Arg) A34 adenosine deaminase TadA
MSIAKTIQTRFELTLPDWMGPFLAAWSEPLDSDEARMRLVVALAAENVRQETGGPFAALVVEDQSGRLLGAGVNRVTASGLSLAHAEMLALSLAQRVVHDWNLGSGGAVQLVTSCEPCAMCFGAIPWSGVSSLLWGACKEDAEAAGFDEGDKPADWANTLEARGIRTRGGVLRSEAAAILQRYASTNGNIYHPGTA